jgi:epsin
MEPNGKDQGLNVQKKARSLLALINDRGKIRELREKAAAHRDK